MKVIVAQTLDDLMKVMVIRGIVFMGEQKHPYNTEFDANELVNRTHLLALQDKEPVGTMRIMKDGKEAKFERLAVLPDYRGKGTAEDIMQAALDYCQEEKVERVFLFCKPELVKYWKDRGFTKVGGDKILKYGKMLLVPVMKQIQEKTSETYDYQQIPEILKHHPGEWINSSQDNMALIMREKLRQRNL